MPEPSSDLSPDDAGMCKDASQETVSSIDNQCSSGGNTPPADSPPPEPSPAFVSPLPVIPPVEPPPPVPPPVEPPPVIPPAAAGAGDAAAVGAGAGDAAGAGEAVGAGAGDAAGAGEVVGAGAGITAAGALLALTVVGLVVLVCLESDAPQPSPSPTPDPAPSPNPDPVSSCPASQPAPEANQSTASESFPTWEPEEGISHPTPDEVDEARDEQGPDCGSIGHAIDVLVRDLKFRRWDMQRHGGGDAGHRDAYNRRQADLRRLVGMAKALGCPYNPEADVEIDRPYNFPTPYY